MNYITTNIRFPEDVYMQLKAEAAQRRKSLSAVVRERVGPKEANVSQAHAESISARLDKTAALLGRKLKGFNSTAVIRQMREER